MLGTWRKWFHSLQMISHMNLSNLLRFSLLYLLATWTWEVSGWSQAPSISIPALSIAGAGWAQSLSSDSFSFNTTQALTRVLHCLNNSTTTCNDHFSDLLHSQTISLLQQLLWRQSSFPNQSNKNKTDGNLFTFLFAIIWIFCPVRFPVKNLYHMTQLYHSCYLTTWRT